MNRSAVRLTWITLTWITVAAFAPVLAQTGGEDPVAALAQELGLTQAQKSKMRQLFIQFFEKQENVPTPGQVVVQNRTMLKEIITGSKFDEQRAREFVGKVTAVIEDASVNRLQLRHALYRELTPEQQQKYLETVQSAVARSLE